MATSNSEKTCTRISPSSVVDNRLVGADLDWARDHLGDCTTCRERVDEFQEMALRVEKLPPPPLTAAGLDDALEAAIPARLRAKEPADYERAHDGGVHGSRVELTSAAPSVTAMADMMTELEREIFRDRSVHNGKPAKPIDGEAAILDKSDDRPSEVRPVAEHPFADVLFPTEFEETVWMTPPTPLKEIEETPWVPPPPQAKTIDPPVVWEPPPQPAPAWEAPRTVDPWEAAAPVEEEPIVEPAAPSKSKTRDNLMRITVGVGAAACVLLAALLYEGGGLFPLGSKAQVLPSPSASVMPTPSVVPSATPAPTPSPSPSVAPSVEPTPSATPVSTPVASVRTVATLGSGVNGENVFRIRTGTGAGYTRVVFDIKGSGFPSIVVQQDSTGHVIATFKNTTGRGLVAPTVRTGQVSDIKQPAQNGPDLVVTIDQARSVRVVAFMLAASGTYPPRLVIDLYNN